MEVFHVPVLRHETSDHFFIEACKNPAKILVIDRLNQEISLVDNNNAVPATAHSKPILGIVGTIRLLAGQYLVVITKSSKAGTINGQDIWRIERTELLPFSRTLLHLTDDQVIDFSYWLKFFVIFVQVADNKMYVAMIEQVLSTPFLYYSYTYDLTQSLQRLHNTTPEFLQVNDY